MQKKTTLDTNYCVSTRKLKFWGIFLVLKIAFEMFSKNCSIFIIKRNVFNMHYSDIKLGCKSEIEV